jgi:hypothetical protein
MQNCLIDSVTLLRMLQSIYDSSTKCDSLNHYFCWFLLSRHFIVLSYGKFRCLEWTKWFTFFLLHTLKPNRTVHACFNVMSLSFSNRLAMQLTRFPPNILSQEIFTSWQCMPDDFDDMSACFYLWFLTWYDRFNSCKHVWEWIYYCGDYQGQDPNCHFESLVASEKRDSQTIYFMKDIGNSRLAWWTWPNRLSSIREKIRQDNLDSDGLNLRIIFPISCSTSVRFAKVNGTVSLWQNRLAQVQSLPQICSSLSKSMIQTMTMLLERFDICQARNACILQSSHSLRVWMKMLMPCIHKWMSELLSII